MGQQPILKLFGVQCINILVLFRDVSVFSWEGTEGIFGRRSKEPLQRFNIGESLNTRDKAGEAGADEGLFITRLLGYHSHCNLCHYTLKWARPRTPR